MNVPNSALDEFLFVVPARGGSKGIPRKNLATYRGQPLIKHTLDSLRELPFSPTVIVSSEDEEILSYCQNEGFGTDYRRPLRLASDTTSVVEVVLDAYEWMRNTTSKDFTFAVLLQPTSPLRRAEDILAFTRVLYDTKIQSLVSVCPMDQHPMECVVVPSAGEPWEYVVPPPRAAHGRQSYTGQYFFINGALYGATPEYLQKHRNFLVPGETFLFEMSAEFSLDIDNPEDLLR